MLSNTQFTSRVDTGREGALDFENPITEVPVIVKGIQETIFDLW